MLQSSDTSPALYPPSGSLEQMRAPGLTIEFDSMLRDIAEKLPAQRCLVTDDLLLSKSGMDPIELRCGERLPAQKIREVMLRLELTQNISPVGFDSLMAFLTASPPPKEIGLLDGLTLESYGLGKTFELPGAKTGWQQFGLSMLEGISSVFSFGGLSTPQPPWPNSRRYQNMPKLVTGFEPSEEVRSVATSAALRLEGRGWILRSPERASGE